MQPDFPEGEFPDEEGIAKSWLKYFTMDAPLVCLAVCHSADPAQLALRLEHVHCFSRHGDGGHYHYDTTPQSVHYEGYFVFPDQVFRIDGPSSSL